MQSAGVFTIFLFIGVSLATFDSINCTLPRVRNRWGSLTPTQQQNYLRAVQELKKYQEIPYPGATFTLSLFDIFSLTHSSTVDADYAHGAQGFFPWHRHYMWYFESALQEIVTKYNYKLKSTGATTGFLDACVTVPYWDWENDYQKETKASVFSANTFGSYINDLYGCVEDGMFAGWNGADGNCLYRTLDITDYGGIAAGAAQIMNYIAGKETYSTYCNNIQVSPHGSIHMWIGGDDGNMGNMISPDDPLFYCHHSNIDRLWALWQDCYDYEKLTISSSLSSNVFPTSWRSAADSRTIYYRNVAMPYNVEIDGVTYPSYRFSTTSVTPLDMQSIGIGGKPGINGMLYRFGQDAMVKSLNAVTKGADKGVCNFDSWFNYVPPNKKRSMEQDWFNFNDTEIYNDFNDTNEIYNDFNDTNEIYNDFNDTNESYNDTTEEENYLFGSEMHDAIFKEIEELYSHHDPVKKLHYLALWECSEENKLDDRNYSVPLEWCKMNKLDPEDWKTVCEKTGWIHGYKSAAAAMEEQLLNNQKQLSWVIPVSITAGVIVLSVIIAVIAIFIVKRKSRYPDSYVLQE